MNPEDDNRAVWKKIVSVFLASAFFLSALTMMVILLVIGEGEVPDSLVNFLYLTTPITLVSWIVWGWVSSIIVEKMDESGESQTPEF